MRWLLAAVHLLALGIGLGAVWARSRALRGSLDAAGLRRVFAADTWWGVSAGLWILTGLLRALAGYEKGAAYYLHNHLFLAKMGLLLLILALEIAPMIGLIRWRAVLAKGQPPDTSSAPRFARTSTLQAVLVVLMVIAATGMARGFGTPTQ
jgi:putative membrane protein